MDFTIWRFCVQKLQNILQHLQDKATHTKRWRWIHTRRLRDCEPKWQNSRVAETVKRKNRFDQRKPELVGVPQMDKC